MEEQEYQALNEFSRKVRKVSEKRNHKVSGSYGVRDAFRYYQGHHPEGREYVLRDVEFYSIIRTVNDLMCDELRKSNIITLPHNMGKILGVKFNTKVEYCGKKLYNNYPINFPETFKLWLEDEDSRRNRTLVRSLDKEMYKLVWDRNSKRFTNSVFFIMKFNRELRKSIRALAKAGKYDTYLERF